MITIFCWSWWISLVDCCRLNESMTGWLLPADGGNRIVLNWWLPLVDSKAIRWLTSWLIDWTTQAARRVAAEVARKAAVRQRLRSKAKHARERAALTANRDASITAIRTPAQTTAAAAITPVEEQGVTGRDLCPRPGTLIYIGNLPSSSSTKVASIMVGCILPPTRTAVRARTVMPAPIDSRGANCCGVAALGRAGAARRDCYMQARGVAVLSALPGGAIQNALQSAGERSPP